MAKWGAATWLGARAGTHRLSNDSSTAAAVDIVAIPVRSKKIDKEPELAKVDKSLGNVFADYAKDEGFEGKRGQTLKIPSRGRVKAKWVLFVGIGKDADDVRAARQPTIMRENTSTANAT